MIYTYEKYQRVQNTILYDNTIQCVSLIRLTQKLSGQWIHIEMVFVFRKVGNIRVNFRAYFKNVKLYNVRVRNTIYIF